MKTRPNSVPFTTFSAALFAYAAFHGLACAQMFINETIGVNFQGNATVSAGTLTTDLSAGVLPQVDWNNINFSPPAVATGGTDNLPVTTSNLWFDNGVAVTHGTSAVSLLVQAASSNKTTPFSGTPGNQKLMNGIIKANAVNPDPTFSFGGLAAGNYQVIVYTVQNGAGGKYSLGLGGTTYYQTAQSGGSFSTFIRGTNITDGLATPPTANYVQFDSSSTVNGTMSLAFHYQGGSDGAGIAGIQLKLLKFIDVWSGSTNGNWDVNTTANWNGNGAAFKFLNADIVSFGDVDSTLPVPVAVTNRTINVAGAGVSPEKITVNNSTGDYIFGGGSINGATSVTKSGTSSLILNSTNAYSGGTVVNGGTVQLGATNALGSGGSLSLASGTTLDLNGNNQTIGALTDNNGTVTNTSATTTGTLTVGSGTVRTDFGEVALGNKIMDGTSPVALAKNTAGTLALKSLNTYSGGTTVSAGTLSIGDNGALGSGGVSLAGGTTLSFDAGNAGLYEGLLSGGANATGANPNTFIRSTTRLANVTAAQQTFANGLPDNSTVIYSGFINNPGAAAPWTFAENFDDYASLKINGVTVLNDGAWNSPTLGTVNMIAGLNSFELRLGQGGGGVGPSNQSWFTGGLGLGVDTQGRGAQVAGNYIALPVDSGNGSAFITGGANNIANAVTLTGNATINVGYNAGGTGTARVGSLAVGSNTLRLSGGAPSVAITSGATALGNATFNVDANVSFTTGALNGGAAPVTLIKSGGGVLRFDKTATALAAGSSIAVNGGTLALGGGLGEFTTTTPFGTGAVTLNSGTTLLLDGQNNGPGLLGEYFSIAPQNTNNINPNFNTLGVLNAHLAGFTPTVALTTATNGKTNFDFSNVNYGNGTPFNGPEATRGNYGFTNTDNMEVRWTGYINITQTGLAHFESTSDDGSMVFIDDNDTPVVNNNAFHGAVLQAGDYDFTTTGAHKITLAFYEGGGGAGALFRWNQFGDSLHTLLNSEVFSPLAYSIEQSYPNNVALTANATISVNHSLKANIGLLSLGANTLSITSPDPTTGAYSVNASGTTLTGNPIFNVADSTGGGKGTLSLGAVNDGGIARTITKTNTGTLRVDALPISIAGGTLFDIQQGTLAVGGVNTTVGNNPLGNSSVRLSGGKLSLEGYSTIEPLQTFNNNVAVTQNAEIIVSSTLAAGFGVLSIGGQTLTVSSPNTTAAAYSLAAASTTITGNVTFNITNSAGGTGTFSPNVIAGGGNSITKTGNGILLLDQANVYSGGTTISGGTVTATGNVSLGAAAAPVSISNSAVLQAGGTLSTSARTLTLGAGGGGKIDTNSNIVTFGVGSTITGTTLMKIGDGKLAIGGTQTYGTLNTRAGRTDLSSALGTGTSSLIVGAETNSSVSQTLASLVIENGAVFTLGELPPGAPPEFGGVEFIADQMGGDLAGSSGQAVPEPGSAMLALTGFLTMLGLRCRKR